MVVIAVVFIAMWWMTQPTMKEVDEENVVESFDASSNSIHTVLSQTVPDYDAELKQLDVSNSYINTKNIYSKCVIPEKLRSLKTEILDALPGAMLTVDDKNNNVVTEQNNYAKFCLNFILSQEPTQQSSSSECKLRAYVFFTYDLSGQMYADIRSMTFSVDPSKTRVFVPIDCNVIDRKRAASARIIRLLIEFEDPSSDSNSAIGIEKVAVVTFGAKDNESEAETYKQTAVELQGKRIRYGVLQVDPVMLVSNNNVAKSTYHLPHAQAILGNVVYDGYRTPYPSNSTKTYRMRLRFDKSHNDTNVWFLQFDPSQFNANKSIDSTYNMHSLLQNDFTNAPRLSNVSHSNTEDNIAGGINGLLTSRETNNEADTYSSTDEDLIKHKTFGKENVTKISFGDVEPDKEYECTFACADPRVTKGQSKTRIYMPNTIKLTYLEIVPMNSQVDSDHNPRIIENYIERPKYIQFNTSRLDEHTEDTFSACADYIVDGDASILRFNQDPMYKSGSENAMPLCTRPNIFSPPITVNDGWMYSGTLRLPLVHPLTDENRLLHMNLKTTARATFDFTISRIGAYLHLNGQPVAMCKMNLTANIVKFSIYIYKNMYGISINNQQPGTTGISPKLYSLYYTAGRALTKDEMSTSRHLASYPKIKEIRVKIDKEAMIRSRFISAIAYEPRSIDLLKLTPDECETRLTRTAFVWSKSVNAEHSGTVDLTKEVTDSISWQMELKGSDITDDIAAKEKGVSSGQPEMVLDAVYPDAEKTPSETQNRTPDRECHLVKMAVGNKDEPLVTVFLSSVSKLYARQYEIQVRFDGCQSGPFDKRAPTYALGDQMLFHIPSTSAQKHIADTRRIIIKCTLHKQRLRVCLFVKHKDEAPVLMKSFAHEVSSVDLKSEVNKFPHLKFDKAKVHSIVCADRATSTLCNPHSLAEDKKNKTGCKINPMTGTRMGDPNYRITDFPVTTSLAYAKNNKYSDYKCSQTNRFSNKDLPKCLEEAKKTFPQGHVTYVAGNNTSESGCNANCIIGDGPCKLVDMKDDQSNYTTYSFYNNADVVDHVAQTLRYSE